MMQALWVMGAMFAFIGLMVFSPYLAWRLKQRNSNSRAARLFQVFAAFNANRFMRYLGMAALVIGPVVLLFTPELGMAALVIATGVLMLFFSQAKPSPAKREGVN